MAYRSRKRAALNRELATYVTTRMVEARTAWSPEYARMLTCCRLMRGLPYLADDVLTGNITFPVIPSITEAVRAAISDVFGDTVSAPFSMQPSTLVDLPPQVTAWLSQQLSQNLEVLEQVTGGDPAKVPLALQGLRETVKQELQAKAQDAAGQMKDTITERLLVGGWENAFDEFITNLCTYPAAVLKGPFLKTRKVRRWDATQMRLVFEDGAVWSYEAVNPFYFYPAPFARDAQTAEYVIEISRLGAVDFAYLALTDDYDALSIQDVQQEYPGGHLEEFFTGGKRSPDYDFMQAQIDTQQDTQGFYDVMIFSGRIEGRILNGLGGYDLNDYEWYEAQVEVCAGHTIKAVINPNPSGHRGYHAMSLFKVPGSFFGECVPTRLLDTQRTCESAVRSLIRNQSWASGPIAQVDVDRVSDDDDPTVLEPGIVKFTRQRFSGQNIPAYHFYDVPSHARELNELIDSFVEKGYLILGFSPVSLGNNNQPSLNRTQGGMAIALNQAAKPLKMIVSSIGREVVKPAIQALTDLEMMTTTDTSILGDIHVHVTGVEGLADDDAKAQRIQQAIQSLAGMAQFLVQPTPLTPLAMHLFSSWLKLEGISTAGLPNFDLQSSFAQDTGAAYNGGMSDQPNPAAPPMPGLSGQSAAAASAIQTSNNIPQGIGGRSP